MAWRRRWSCGARRKGAPKQVRIARRLRTETPMTLNWIATELHMAAWAHVSNLLSRQRRNRKRSDNYQTVSLFGTDHYRGVLLTDSLNHRLMAGNLSGWPNSSCLRETEMRSC